MFVLFLSLIFIFISFPLPREASPDQVFLSEEEAPRAIFPEADRFVRKVVVVTPEIKQRLKELLGKTKPSIWEPYYITYRAQRNGKQIGYAVIVNEIGKHRAFTFIVGVDLEGKVKEVSIMVYRESRGGEVRNKRFLKQYRKKRLKDSLMPYRGIQNITGATLSVYAVSRGVKKALSLVQIVYLDNKQREE
jgi:Na+-translocating ferredoxin:NAD+ oxidoreductase RnfG subunit